MHRPTPLTRRLCAAAAITASTAAALFCSPALAIVGGTATTGFGQVSNGVQITPNWVLTAAHLGFAAGSGYSNAYGSSTVAARYLPGPGPFPADDLALLRLDAPIGGAPVLALSADLLAPGSYPALDVTIATGRNQVPRGYGFTLLQEVLSSVEYENPPGTTSTVPVNWLVTYTSGVGQPYVQGGDSGGGLFLGHVTDSVTPLLGIASAQLESSDGVPTSYASAFVQLAGYRSWIDTTMAADTNDNQLPLWLTGVVPVPEPATWLLWLAGAGLLGGLARRRPSAG